MSKNIIIGPTGEETIYNNISIIRTPLVEGGVCNWVPENEIIGGGGKITQDQDIIIISPDGNTTTFITEEFTYNGIFLAPSGKAYSSVTVNIPDSANRKW